MLHRFFNLTCPRLNSSTAAPVPSILSHLCISCLLEWHHRPFKLPSLKFETYLRETLLVGWPNPVPTNEPHHGTMGHSSDRWTVNRHLLWVPGKALVFLIQVLFPSPSSCFLLECRHEGKSSSSHFVTMKEGPGESQRLRCWYSWTHICLPLLFLLSEQI